MPSLRKSIADKLLLIQVRKLHSVTKGLKTLSFKISQKCLAIRLESAFAGSRRMFTA
jgi:hypothetical protein